MVKRCVSVEEDRYGVGHQRGDPPPTFTPPRSPTQSGANVNCWNRKRTNYSTRRRATSDRVASRDFVCRVINVISTEPRRARFKVSTCLVGAACKRDCWRELRSAATEERFEKNRVARLANFHVIPLDTLAPLS